VSTPSPRHSGIHLLETLQIFITNSYVYVTDVTNHITACDYNVLPVALCSIVVEGDDDDDGDGDGKMVCNDSICSCCFV
jgi:hypothetical protein